MHKMRNLSPKISKNSFTHKQQNDGKNAAPNNQACFRFCQVSVVPVLPTAGSY